jgi:hypothetical protein
MGVLPVRVAEVLSEQPLLDPDSQRLGIWDATSRTASVADGVRTAARPPLTARSTRCRSRRAATAAQLPATARRPPPVRSHPVD